MKSEKNICNFISICNLFERIEKAWNDIADSVLNDKRQLVPVSACLDGQYGHSDVAIGVPAVIGKDGIHEIIELELDDAEKSVFDAGVTNVKNAIKSMDL